MPIPNGFAIRYRVDPDGCWRWIGYVSPDGYGRYSTGYPARRDTMAHRIAYVEWVSPIPKGMTIDHLCRVRSCVNPAHMEMTTFQVNIDRRDTTNIGARNREKTHCPKGHPLDEANTMVEINKSGRHRKCRICANARRRLVPA